MRFDEIIIQEAWNKANMKEDKLFEIIFEIQYEKNTKYEIGQFEVKIITKFLSNY